MKLAYEFKTKSKETEKYLKEILFSQSEMVDSVFERDPQANSNDEVDDSEDFSVTPYNPPATLANFNRHYDAEDSLLEEQSYNEQSNGSVRSRGCEIHTCHICAKVFKYVKPFRNHLRQQHGLSSDQSSPQQQNDMAADEPSEDSSDDFPPPVKGRNSGEFSCKVCKKEFKYIKPLKSHMKLHHTGSVTKSGNKKRSLAKSTFVPASIEKQPPYDSRSPYRDEIQFPQDSPHPSTRDSSPDFASTILNSSLNDVLSVQEPSPKRLRLRKQKLPSRSPTPEKQPAPAVLKKGRKQAEKKDAPEQLPSLFDGFSEVDVNSVLKSKAFSFLGEDSQSCSAPSTSRSRSASVELVPEFDIFGSSSVDVLHNSPLKTVSVDKQKPGKTFSCDIRGCDLKFHLKANLRRHQQEVHKK